jgi:hypothetical protein
MKRCMCEPPDCFDRFEEGDFQVVARRSSDFSTSHQLDV